MIVFSKVIPPYEGVEVYNLTSLYEGFYRLNLIPPFQIFDNCSNNLDLLYMNWIFSYEPAYNDFMNIVVRLHENKNVCILVIQDDSFSMIDESLQKLLSERYGIISNIANSIEDWYELTDIGPQTVQQILTFDNDRDRFLDKLYNTDPNLLFYKDEYKELD